MNVYGQRIATARKLAGLTQEQLAERLGVDVQTVKRKENPNGKEPKPLERIAIAAVCGVSQEFLEGSVTDPELAQDPADRRLRDIEGQVTALSAALRDLSTTVLQQRRELKALRDQGRRGGRGAGGER